MATVPQHRKVAWAATCAAVVATAVAGPSASPAVEKIERYCRASWRNAGIARAAWEDCTQEALTELLSRVTCHGLDPAIGDQESLERRELNRTIWCVIQRWRRAPRYLSLPRDELLAGRESLNVLEAESALQEILARSTTRLSRRQLQVLELCSLGHSIPEIAAALRLRAEQVSDTKYKAIHKLRRARPVADT